MLYYHTIYFWIHYGIIFYTSMLQAGYYSNLHNCIQFLIGVIFIWIVFCIILLLNVL